MALHAIANAQKAGGIAAFIDAEHALDPDYAQKLGVDTDALLVSQPDTGEQALEIADMLIRSNALDIIVIDSVAALVPRAEIEGEMGDSHVGLQARLMSQALRKLTGALHNSKTTAIFINQLREKIGVMFGCFSYDTRVTLADGSQEKIGKIVNQRMPVEVLSYDPTPGEIVPKQGRELVRQRPDRSVPAVHRRAVGRERAGAVRGDRQPPDPDARRMARGRRAARRRPRHAQAETHPAEQPAVAGGARRSARRRHLSPNRRVATAVRFRMGHGAKQADYLDWKVSLLGNIAQLAPHRTPRVPCFADFTPLPELGELQEVVYLGDGKKHLTWDYLKALTPLALAVWYMDDGCFHSPVQGRSGTDCGRLWSGEICVEAMSPGSRERMVEHLAGRWA